MVEGEYKDDGGILMRHGQGKYIDATSNSVYTGTWDGDKMSGKGSSLTLPHAVE